MLMMVCSGASEQAVSQWASTFAEEGLGIAKTMGDLGCSSGPTLVGFVSGAAGDMRLGILAGIVAPVLLRAGIYRYKEIR